MNYCIQHWLSFLELCIWCAVNALYSILLVVGQACRGLKLALCSFGLIWPVFPPWALVFSLFLQHGGGAVGLYAWGLYCSEKSDRKPPLFYYCFLQRFFFIFFSISVDPWGLCHYGAWQKATRFITAFSLFFHIAEPLTQTSPPWKPQQGEYNTWTVLVAMSPTSTDVDICL